MSRRHWLVMLLCGCLAVAGRAQWQLGARLGITYGGAIPTESDPDSSSGSGRLLPALRFSVARDLGERFRLEAGLTASLRGATYGQLYRNDTLMPLEIFPGVTDTVPTYYLADARGRMDLAYLEMPLLLHWRPTRRMEVFAGPYLGCLVRGQDVGTVQIQIGDGTLFPDTTVRYDNIGAIHRLDHGFCLGGSFVLVEGLHIECMAQRSTRGLYRRGFLASQGLPEVPLYHTQFAVALQLWIPVPDPDR